MTANYSGKLLPQSIQNNNYEWFWLIPIITTTYEFFLVYANELDKVFRCFHHNGEYNLWTASASKASSVRFCPQNVYFESIHDFVLLHYFKCLLWLSYQYHSIIIMILSELDCSSCCLSPWYYNILWVMYISLLTSFVFSTKNYFSAPVHKQTLDQSIGKIQ